MLPDADEEELELKELHDSGLEKEELESKGLHDSELKEEELESNGLKEVESEGLFSKSKSKSLSVKICCTGRNSPHSRSDTHIGLTGERVGSLGGTIMSSSLQSRGGFNGDMSLPTTEK